MSGIKIPEFTQFKKNTVDGADFTEYVYEHKDYKFSIQHDSSDETSYGWSVWIISPIDRRCIGSEYIQAKDAYKSFRIMCLANDWLQKQIIERSSCLKQSLSR